MFNWFRERRRKKDPEGSFSSCLAENSDPERSDPEKGRDQGLNLLPAALPAAQPVLKAAWRL